VCSSDLGHADGDSDLEHVAEKEAREETSIPNLRLLSHVPISLDTLPVSGHFKRGKYVPAHIHLSIAYLYEADEEELIRIKEDENSGVEWLTFDELLNKSTEPHMLKVYSKIINKIKQYNTT
jgi:8-oxo-dGTP pyrophosphatase MutT (NUDIX family)